jgi:hypothetical protein
MSYQTIIENEIKKIKEGDEIISLDEFLLMVEAEYYRPPGEKWYSKHRELTGFWNRVGAGVAGIATLGLYKFYRNITDRCRQNCKGIEGKAKEKCIVACNLNASKRVIQLIKANKSKLGSIKDPEKRQKAKNMIDKELAKWESRYDRYQSKLTALSNTVVGTNMSSAKHKRK